MKMDMYGGGHARRGRIEEQCAPPSIKHELHSVKTRSEDEWKMTHGHHFYVPIHISWAFGFCSRNVNLPDNYMEEAASCLYSSSSHVFAIISRVF